MNTDTECEDSWVRKFDLIKNKHERKQLCFWKSKIIFIYIMRFFCNLKRNLFVCVKPLNLCPTCQSGIQTLEIKWRNNKWVWFWSYWFIPSLHFHWLLQPLRYQEHLMKMLHNILSHVTVDYNWKYNIYILWVFFVCLFVCFCFFWLPSIRICAIRLTVN